MGRSHLLLERMAARFFDKYFTKGKGMRALGVKANSRIWRLLHVNVFCVLPVDIVLACRDHVLL